MQYAKLPVIDGSLFVQIISTRDKFSGKYLPTMDGNLNVTLHRIYNVIDDIQQVMITLPMIYQIDHDNLLQFKATVKKLFGNKILLLHVQMYGDSVAETRKLILDPASHARKQFDSFVHHETKFFNAKQIISDFPIEFNSKIDVPIIYNYNWGKSSNDIVDDASKYFSLEVDLAKHHSTFLYSDVQYNYWKAEGQATDLVFRSVAIFNKDMFQSVSTDEVNSMDAATEYLIDQFIQDNKTIVFYPSRIEDPRYCFNHVLFISEICKFPLIISNPTNIKSYDNKLYSNAINSHFTNVLDLSNVPNKRAAYFYVLSKLRPDDMIFRFETDMHISLIEQKILTEAKIVHPHFADEDVFKYLND